MCLHHSPSSQADVLKIKHFWDTYVTIDDDNEYELEEIVQLYNAYEKSGISIEVLREVIQVEYPHISIGEANGILFYINAFNKGSVFNRKDVDHFLKQLNISPDLSFYNPCSNIQIIKRVLRNLISAYEKQSNMVKSQEINTLLNMLLEIEPDKN
jgi:hypothetical protein